MRTDALAVLNSDRFGFAQLMADIPSAINDADGINRVFGFVRVIEDKIIFDRETA